MRVIKRDGKREEFKEKNVFNAINAANKSVDSAVRINDEQIQKVVEFIVKDLEKKELAFQKEQQRKKTEYEKQLEDNVDLPPFTPEEFLVDVEEIQDLVEKGLQNKNCYDVAKAFILYRDQRAKERFKRLDIMKRIKTKLDASDVQNQNANLDEHSFGGRKGEADGELLKQMALDYYISAKFAKNHLENRIYIHDLDNYVVGMHNCLSVPMDFLLKYGFNTRQVDIRPASSINTAMQLVAVLFQLQSLQQFGGVSATHLDWTMVPYVRISFFKHFKRSLEYYNRIASELLGESFDPVELTITREEAEHVSINDKRYKAIKTVYDEAIELTEKETYQAVEGMYHNLNSLQSRSGNQLPFSSINYGTCTLPEGRMVTRAILEASIDGVGKLHKTSIFPCGIFQKMKGVNDKGSKNYDLYKLALKSTAKRLYPNYANCDWSGNDDTKSYELKADFIDTLSNEQKSKLLELLKDETTRSRLGLELDGNNIIPIRNAPDAIFSTMGCRTANGFDVNWFADWKIAVNEYINGNVPKYNFLATGQQKDGRGNIAPATIILPTLAMEARKKAKDNPEYVVDFFMDILEKAIGDCKDELLERFNWIAAQNKNSAKFMYENGTMFGYKEEEGIRSALKHGTLAIGQLGLAEALQILVGCDQTTEQGMKVAKQIEGLFKTKCAEYKEHYKLNFGVYYTPAESLCFTAMKKFRAKYGEIKNVTYSDIEGSDKKDYRQFFTNSIHVPVWVKMDPFEKIDTESELTGYSSAGCITYVELDDRTQNNLKALEQIVDYAMEKDIPYFAINVPADTCLECGYQGQIDNECPVCGARDLPGDKKIQRLRRVTGYLTGDFETAFNLGKQDETRHRYKHSESMVDWHNQTD